ncbi:uncharacterized protein LOC103574190 [Microplitis demolitor]|uniref:uncharacterized protein LOC103574190 n=1 Tax=Microplitis demolitor TaxID=69319 RepID=UPI0004CDB2A9|nr:uncharacterized protein LOC103574190 [Microplitis demolitor]
MRNKEELMLFKLLIDEIKIIVTTGVSKNTWTSESIDKFYDECFNNIYQLRRVIGDYKLSFKKIYCCLKNISETLFVEGTINSIYTLEEFESHLKNIRNKSLENINEECKQIYKLISLIKYDIRRDDKTPNYWTTFVEKIIENLKESLLINIRMSLLSARRFFEGDGLTNPEPLLIIEAHYLNDQIILQPDVEEIRRVIELITALSDELYSIENCNKIFELIDLRLEDGINLIEVDEEIIGLKNHIKKETEIVIEALDKFIQSINITKQLLDIETKLSEMKQDARKYDINILEEEIQRCKELYKVIPLIADNINIYFVLLKTVNMKSGISEKCDYLKDILFVELSRSTC